MFNQSAPLEDGFQVFPHATVWIFYYTLSKLSLLYLFSARSLLSALTYLSGIVVLDMNQTPHGIANAFGIKSHDALTRFLKSHTSSSASLMLSLVKLASRFSPGYLVVDDVIIPKEYSRKIPATYWVKDHTKKRHVFAQTLVVILWSNGFIKIPVAVELWHKRGFVTPYQTKNQIARRLLKDVTSRGLKPQYIALDSWYASRPNLSFIRQLGYDFVTRLKKNSRVKFNNLSLTTYQLSKNFPKGFIRYYPGLQAYARKLVITYPRFGQLALVVVKHDPHQEPGQTKYIITNNLALTTRCIVELYRSRWDIEVFFRDIKQHLGAGACQSRDLITINRHFALVFLAYTCLDFIRNHKTETIGDVKRNLQSQIIVTISGQTDTLIKFQKAQVKRLPEIQIVKEQLGTRFSEQISSKFRLNARFKTSA
jgi:SRSO17 transposase